MDERIHAERIPYLSMHSAFHIPIPSQHTDIYEPTLCYGPPSFSKTIIGNHVFFPHLSLRYSIVLVFFFIQTRLFRPAGRLGAWPAPPQKNVAQRQRCYYSVFWSWEIRSWLIPAPLTRKFIQDFRRR